VKIFINSSCSTAGETCTNLNIEIPVKNNAVTGTDKIMIINDYEGGDISDLCNSTKLVNCRSYI